MDLEKLSNILGADTVKKIYEDGLSEPVQETGKMLTDFVKAFRLFTAPIQLLGSYQDRLVKYLEKVRNSVPEENQIEAPALLSGPIIERLKYLEESNYLTDLYLNLLTRAINRERVNEAHPAFFHIIDQLSPDEAVLLSILIKTPIRYDYNYPEYSSETENYWKKEIIQDTTPKDSLVFIENFEMYVEHLSSLNLILWNKVETIQNSRRFVSSIFLTEFGSMFVKACILS